MAAVERDLVVYANDADGSFGRWQDVFVIVRRGRLTLESVELQRRTAEEHLQSANALGLLYVYEPTAELPDRASRLATAKVFEELRPRIVCVGVVFEGDGVKFTMMRVVVRSMGALFGQGSKRFICARVEEAAQWMAPLLPRVDGAPVDHAALAAAVSRLRGRGRAARVVSAFEGR
jgi:hypothetical protein